MHSKDGFHCYYNVQTAVDDGSHLIADFEVTNHNTDQVFMSTQKWSTVSVQNWSTFFPDLSQETVSSNR
jgi:hypothetical protein